MPAQYTADAIRAIWFAAHNFQSPTTIRAELGWSDGMFNRICARHGIRFDIASRIPAARPQIATVARVAPAVASRSKAVHLTVAVSTATRNEFIRLAAARDEAVSCYIADLLADALGSGEAAACIPYRGEPRGTYVNTTVAPPIRDALARVMRNRHSSMSALIAAVMEWHLVVNEKRSAR